MLKDLEHNVLGLGLVLSEVNMSVTAVDCQSVSENDSLHRFDRENLKMGANLAERACSSCRSNERANSGGQAFRQIINYISVCFTN